MGVLQHTVSRVDDIPVVADPLHACDDVCVGVAEEGEMASHRRMGRTERVQQKGAGSWSWAC